jgi:hypothetical protein
VDSDDDDEPEKEEEPEPEPDDIPGKIKYYLHHMIQVADLHSLTTRLCKEHIKEKFGEQGDAVCAEHKTLIKTTIDLEVQKRGSA